MLHERHLLVQAFGGSAYHGLCLELPTLAFDRLHVLLVDQLFHIVVRHIALWPGGSVKAGRGYSVKWWAMRSLS